MQRSLLLEKNENNNDPSLPPDQEQLIQQVQCEFDDNLNHYAEALDLILSTLKELDKNLEDNEEYKLQEQARKLIEFTNHLADDLEYMHHKDFIPKLIEHCKKNAIEKIKNDPALIPEIRLYNEFKDKMYFLVNEYANLLDENKIIEINNIMMLLKGPKKPNGKLERKQLKELDELIDIINENITDIKIREEILNMVFFLKKEISHAKNHPKRSIITVLIISSITPKIRELVFSFKKMTDESKTANRSSPEWKEKVNQFIAKTEDFKKYVRQNMARLTFGQMMFVNLCMAIGMFVGMLTGSMVSPFAGSLTGAACGGIGGVVLGHYLVNKVSFFRTHTQNTLSYAPTLMQKSFPLPTNAKRLR